MTIQEAKQKVVDEAVAKYNQELEERLHHIMFVGDDTKDLCGLLNQPRKEE